MKDVNDIIYNCRKATQLIEKKQIERLTIKEKMELQLHLAGCSVCRLYQHQSKLIHKQIKQLLRHTTAPKRSLDEMYKKDLQDQIDKKIK